ncbi:hypothetical protein QEH34_gp63 [Microbacterium phage Footloose]|uniref:DUF7210 domain-containing protein n=1 Tax=Microbacterium phage Footloose TaxID=2836048 RepID=A0A8F3IPI1_9CAUD|nr:hypothetical protein QEH34_gp63 [Microbacterium phage Footloose]QWY84651.1 hypothetical protein SEA_FOOTLOOSE_72 [Microbacterium phage Footloose]
MSTKIKINTNLGGRNTGDTIDVTPKTAEYLIDNGYAEAAKARATKKTDDTND